MPEIFSNTRHGTSADAMAAASRKELLQKTASDAAQGINTAENMKKLAEYGTALINVGTVAASVADHVMEAAEANPSNVQWSPPGQGSPPFPFVNVQITERYRPRGVNPMHPQGLNESTVDHSPQYVPLRAFESTTTWHGYDVSIQEWAKNNGFDFEKNLRTHTTRDLATVKDTVFKRLMDKNISKAAAFLSALGVVDTYPMELDVTDTIWRPSHITLMRQRFAGLPVLDKPQLKWILMTEEMYLNMANWNELGLVNPVEYKEYNQDLGTIPDARKIKSTQGYEYIITNRTDLFSRNSIYFIGQQEEWLYRWAKRKPQIEVRQNPANKNILQVRGTIYEGSMVANPFSVMKLNLGATSPTL